MGSTQTPNLATSSAGTQALESVMTRTGPIWATLPPTERIGGGPCQNLVARRPS